MPARPIRSIHGRGCGSPERWPRPRRRPARDRTARVVGASTSFGVEEQLHQLTGQRRRARTATPAVLDEDGDGDLGVVDRGEPDEPGMRLAGPAELGRPGLAGRRDPRHRGSGREEPPVAALDRLHHGLLDDRVVPRQDLADRLPGRPGPGPPGIAVTSCAHEYTAVRDGRGDEGHLEAVTSVAHRRRRWRARRRGSRPAAAAAFVSWLVAVGRSNGSGA